MTTRTTERPLRILHVLRAPLGGLFRHVTDLAREQVALGHDVGMITDLHPGNERSEAMLDEIAPSLRLGLARFPMRRNPDPSDLVVQARVMARIRALDPHVVHGHGSKGGTYARLPGWVDFGGSAVRAYTPHGGSFNYKPGTAINAAYMAVERVLAARTDLFLFESGFIAGRFADRVGRTRALSRVVPNGISAAEFVPVRPGPDAADFVYVGELREAKGIDTLIDAIAAVGQRIGRSPRAVLVGTGPDTEALRARAARLGLAESIGFPGAMPARAAFGLGRVMVVPSRAESMPYVVLEAAAARVPMIATNVGGIPEIFGPHADRLIACDDARVLAARMARTLAMDEAARAAEADGLATFVQGRFSISAMVDAVLGGYRDAMARKARGPSPTFQAQTATITEDATP